MPDLLYLVMEVVAGGDLEQHVLAHGPVAIDQACDWVRQAACGLQEAHDHHLIHRDVKPSNLLLTSQGHVKVVDFGLARQFCSRLTDPRALLGTVEYMSPEQSRDPSTVFAPADVYGLGATLFWLLTGSPPYLPTRSLSEALHRLQYERPRRVRELRPEVPEALDALVDRMLEPDPAQRPGLPLTVMNALLPFAFPQELQAYPEVTPWAPESPDATARRERSWRVLVVDDEGGFRRLIRTVLEPLGCRCDEAADGAAAVAAAEQAAYDLVLLDLNLPGVDGYEVCRRLRSRPGSPHLKVIIVSGRGDQNELAEALPRGADDYIPKPFEIQQLEAKVQHALRLKEAQERASLLARQLLLTNRQLENSLAARASDVREAHDALLFGMAKMAESRDGETPDHLRRLQRYTRCLAERARAEPEWAGVVDENFLELLERCVPLHDIGKIGLPESVLLKRGRLDAGERALIETHTLIGDRILEALGREYGESLVFLGTARAIVRHHHERYDGRGYPDKLAGDAIPAPARLVAVADVYDALRRERQHKPAWSHAQAVQSLLRESAGQFDPSLLRAFARGHEEFRRVYHDTCM
jgi:putative two-component system response regulator